MLGSKKIIEKNLLKECKYLAYPGGVTNGMIVTWVKRFGYLGAFTERREGNPFYVNKFFVNRSTIEREFGLKEFQNNLLVFRKKALK